MFEQYIKANSRPVKSPVQLKAVLLALAVWVASLFVVFVIPVDLPLATPLAILLFPLTGLGLIVAFVILLFRRGWNHNVAAGIIMVIVLCVGVFGNTIKWGAQLHLLTNKHRYEQIVEKIASSADDKERDRICGEDCFIVTSEPLRVSFHFAHFFLSWDDIVYDRSGTITDPNLENSHRITYFISAERLRGDWYLGRFGD